MRGFEIGGLRVLRKRMNRAASVAAATSILFHGELCALPTENRLPTDAESVRFCDDRGQNATFGVSKAATLLRSEYRRMELAVFPFKQLVLPTYNSVDSSQTELCFRLL